MGQKVNIYKLSLYAWRCSSFSALFESPRLQLVLYSKQKRWKNDVALPSLFLKKCGKTRKGHQKHGDRAAQTLAAQGFPENFRSTSVLSCRFLNHSFSTRQLLCLSLSLYSTYLHRLLYALLLGLIDGDGVEVTAALKVTLKIN